MTFAGSTSKKQLKKTHTDILLYSQMLKSVLYWSHFHTDSWSFKFLSLVKKYSTNPSRDMTHKIVAELCATSYIKLLQCPLPKYLSRLHFIFFPISITFLKLYACVPRSHGPKKSLIVPHCSPLALLSEAKMMRVCKNNWRHSWGERQKEDGAEGWQP